MKKYYFLDYRAKNKKSLEWLNCNTVINIHPLEFILSCNERFEKEIYRINFFHEINEDLYLKSKDYLD